MGKGKLRFVAKGERYVAKGYAGRWELVPEDSSRLFFRLKLNGKDMRACASAGWLMSVVGEVDEELRAEGWEER